MSPQTTESPAADTPSPWPKRLAIVALLLGLYLCAYALLRINHVFVREGSLLNIRDAQSGELLRTYGAGWKAQRMANKGPELLHTSFYPVIYMELRYWQKVGD